MAFHKMRIATRTKIIRKYILPQNIVKILTNFQQPHSAIMKYYTTKTL